MFAGVRYQLLLHKERLSRFMVAKPKLAVVDACSSQPGKGLWLLGVAGPDMESAVFEAAWISRN